MLYEQYGKITSKINNALNDNPNHVDIEVYNGTLNIISSFYSKHRETNPTVEERNELVRLLEEFGDKSPRYILTTCLVIIWVIEAYDLGDQLEKEYKYKRRSIVARSNGIDVESLESIGPEY